MRRLAITLCLFISSLAAQLAAMPAQVIIIPCAEVDAQGNLTQQGLERAGALVAYIALTQAPVAFGKPIAIFAARPVPNAAPYPLAPPENTESCMQTIAPTALFFKKPIHSGYALLQEIQLASFILNKQLYNGKTVLICWHIEGMQALAIALGVAGAPVFPAGVSNLTWVINYAPAIALIELEQDLLFSDAGPI